MTLEYEKDYSHLVLRGQQDMAVLKWNWVEFLTEQEKKEQKASIHYPPAPAKAFDLSKGVKIEYSSEEV